MVTLAHPFRYQRHSKEFFELGKIRKGFSKVVVIKDLEKHTNTSTTLCNSHSGLFNEG
jgi:hypothetical protein